MSLNSSATFDQDLEEKNKKGSMKAVGRSRSSTYEVSQNKVEELGGGDGSTGSFIEEEHNGKK